MSLLSSVAHPNIVSALGTFRNDESFVLVWEYMSGGTLQDKLAFQLTWQQTFQIAKQFCEAVVFAHNNHVVHDHLRFTNVLFDPDGSVKVTEFLRQDDTSDAGTACFYYLEGEESSQSADIFAVGVLLYRLLT